ncbi:uracil-DNA glycosylase [Plesiocystis pacifica SIR-1]|uniref:Uracil-DNA glycosylase n=2 Tax=Plesiocystis pacifica TaxID=191768 RepID=A6G9R7_9BACT|nr:uracil-DNA glycosylase [Plesiocystis pacifica SIR-1]
MLRPMTSLPTWAAALGTPARLTMFETQVRGCLQACVDEQLHGREASASLDGGVASVRMRRGEGRRGWMQAQLGLMNLAQRWAVEVPGDAGETDAESVARGHALIAEHVAVSVRRMAQAEHDDQALRPEALRVRLMNERHAVEYAEGLVQRRLARGLHAALVFDLPEVLRPLTPERAASWERELDAVWAEALERTQAGLSEGEGAVVVERLRLFDRVPVLAITGDSFLTTSRILDLGAVLDAAELGEGWRELGAVVVTPNRHTALAHALGGSTDLATALAALQKAAASLYEQGPGSLSPELYWWRGGALEHIHAGRDRSGRLMLGAPEAFMREVVGEAG